MEKLLGCFMVTVWAVIISLGLVLGASTGEQLQGKTWVKHKRLKRQVTCAQRYREITSGHTRCLQPSPRSESLGDVSPADIKTIVDLHNNARREVTVPATNMVKMSWDDSLAVTATRWALNCQTRHDNGYQRYEFGRFSVGQNLAWGDHDMGWTKAVSLWADEKKDFTYNGGNSLHLVGHYTQMVWAETTKVGCAVALCDGRTFYYVCNYGPAGNFKIDTPYKRGQTCGECPNRCRDKLCDCGNKVCLNGGALDLQTCTCKCSLAFQIEPDCGINCTDIDKTQPRYCSGFDAGDCVKYSNVPQECPKLCRWCPAADYSIINQGQAGNNEPSSSDRTKSSMVPFYLVWAVFLLIVI